jgi:hypothetical protein
MTIAVRRQIHEQAWQFRVVSWSHTDLCVGGEEVRLL